MNYTGNGGCCFLLSENPIAEKHTGYLEGGESVGYESNGCHEERNRENLFQSHQGKVPGLCRGRSVRSSGLCGNGLPVVPLSVWQETRGGNQGTTKILHRQGGKAGKGWIAPWKESSYHQNRPTNWNYFSRPLGASTHNGRYSVL